jgi:hypothetical protein
MLVMSTAGGALMRRKPRTLWWGAAVGLAALSALVSCSEDDERTPTSSSTGAPGTSSSGAGASGGGGGGTTGGGDGGATSSSGGSGGGAASGGSASGGAGGSGGDPGAGGGGGDPSGGAGGGGGSAPFTGVSGPITGVVPAAADVMVAWIVTGNMGHVYNYGDGSISGATFMVGFASDPPPPEALNKGEYGVGFMLLLPSGTKPPTGELMDFEDFEDVAIGAAEAYAVIYRSPAASSGWKALFPLGYSCGACVPAMPNMTFDTFEPTACNQVEMLGGPLSSFQFCNWT